MLWRFYHDRVWKLTDFINGAFAALGSITAGSGYVHPWAAMLIAAVAATLAYYSIILFKDKLKLDDVLDCTSLQGVPGIWGSLAVGFLADAVIQPSSSTDPTPTLGLFYRGPASVVWTQLLTIAVVGLWSAFWTMAIMLFMKIYVGIDITPEMEEAGLDKMQIGEQAYDEELDLLLDVGQETIRARMCAAACEGNLKEMRQLVNARSDPSEKDYDGRTPAHLAAGEGHVNIISYLLSINADCNHKDRFGHSPLYDAFVNKRENVMQVLMAAGATLDTTHFHRTFLEQTAANEIEAVSNLFKLGIDVDICDYDKRTPLMIACSEGHFDMVKLLLENKANPDLRDRWNNTARMSAIEARHKRIAALFDTTQDNSEGKSPNNTSSNNLATPLLSDSADPVARKSYGSTELVNVVDKPKDSASARELCSAAAEGKVSEIKRLLSKGGCPNSGDYDSRTAMHLAAASGHLACIKVLVHAKANINIMDRWHNTPLQDAVTNSHMDTVKWLRSNGGLVINQKKGYDLCKAAFDGDMEALTKLVNEGVDLNIADYDSRTALHLAACEGRKEMVMWLLNNGASCNVSDRYGFTPLDDARKYEHIPIIELLLEYERKETQNSTSYSYSEPVSSPNTPLETKNRAQGAAPFQKLVAKVQMELMHGNKQRTSE